MWSMSKPAKACMFCGRIGQMSKEHAWSQWLGRDIEVDSAQTTLTTGFARTGEGLLSKTPNRHVTKKASVLTTRVREVCAPCNNGWMSRLETAVRPLLERLWAPSYPFCRTTVGVDDAAVLAAWATKTAWVREKAEGPTLTSTPQMRRNLADTRLPPDLTTVWFARFDGSNEFASYLTQSEVTQQEKAWDTGDSRQVLVSAMSFRGLSVAVRTDNGPGVIPMTLPGDVWHTVWPTIAAVQWPPARAANDDNVYNAVAQVSNWSTIPAVPFLRDPEGWHIEHRS